MAMTPLPDEVRSRPRYQTLLSRGAAVAACALLAAACGSTAAPTTSTTGASGTGSSSAGSGSTGTTSAAKVSLDVTFATSATGPSTHYTLHCEPASGTVRDPAVACSRLLTGASLFGPRPAHMLCPMIMASAARARVTGTYLGKAVHETIVDGGCDLGRWSKLKAVFG